MLDVGCSQPGQAGAGEGVGEGGHGDPPGRDGGGIGVGPGGGLFVPVAGELYVAGGLAGDAVGAIEVDLAVKVEILAGEEGIAEFVVGEELNIQQPTSDSQHPTSDEVPGHRCYIMLRHSFSLPIALIHS